MIFLQKKIGVYNIDCKRFIGKHLKSPRFDTQI